MDVRVDANAGLAVGLGHDQVGGLAAHALKRQQRIDRFRHPRIETSDKLAADSDNNSGLGAVEPDRIDKARDLLLAQREHRLRRRRLVRITAAPPLPWSRLWSAG